MSYAALESHFRRLSHFEELGEIVNWDQAVNMPPSAGPRRAEAMASLSRLVHDLVADPRVGEWLAVAQREGELSPWQRANLQEIWKKHTRATALPADLVEATTQ